VQQFTDVHDVLQSLIAISVSLVFPIYYTIHLNIISHTAALSAIGIGRVPCSLCRSVCLSVCLKWLYILEEWLRQLKCHLGWVGPGKNMC